MGNSFSYLCAKNYQHGTWFDRVIEKKIKMVQFLASQGTYIVVHKSYIQTEGACRYTSLHYVVVCNYI